MKPAMSLLLPYWDRQEAANAALRQLDKLYRDADLEVLVIDDGSPVPFECPDVDLQVTVLRLPAKTEPKSPVTPWNIGAKCARGEILILSCIEVLHANPVLDELAQHVRDIGPLGYVLAAAWCPEERVWHTHSSVPVPTCPPGTGLAFLGAMHRDLYFKAGGFDEDYRDGAGYEDRDFIWRMTKAGAQFRIRDDLVVLHPKTGARIKWGAEKFARNADLYRRKWLC